ncbi:protein ALP1-like [Senna tora]|uniref:Protein ALP1-like n=1 Tax=Senna tora TaxID=362788 RepID=A0A834WV20_9FABA|nr:protein ALP1-like [Senna tora]
MRRISPRSYTLNFEAKQAHLRSIVYASDTTCYNQTRMNRGTIDRLCGMLDNIRGLRSSRNMLVDEQVAIFLHILSHQSRWQMIQPMTGGNGSRDASVHSMGPTLELESRYKTNQDIEIERVKSLLMSLSQVLQYAIKKLNGLKVNITKLIRVSPTVKDFEPLIEDNDTI